MKFRIWFVMCLHNTASLSGNPSLHNYYLFFHSTFTASFLCQCLITAIAQHAIPHEKKTIQTIQSYLWHDLHALVSAICQDNKHLEECINKTTSALKLYEGKNENTGETILIYFSFLDCSDNCKNTWHRWFWIRDWRIWIIWSNWRSGS